MAVVRLPLPGLLGLALVSADTTGWQIRTNIAV